MRLGCARPVRSFFRSAWKLWTHFAMRETASFLMSSSIAVLLATPGGGGSLDGHRRTHLLAAHDAGEVAGIVEIEHTQRQAVVAAHHDRGRVHDVEPVGKYLVEAEPCVARRLRVAQRIIGKDPVHLGRLQQHIGIDLDGAQRRRGIGGEERIAGTGGEDRHPSLFQMAHGAAADVVLAHLVDADSGHDAHVHPEALECILHGERIHHRRQHAHVVRCHPVHTGACQSRTAEDVAPADHHGELHLHLDDLAQLSGNTLNHHRIDAVVTLTHQRFARELDENPGERRLHVIHRPFPRPSWFYRGAREIAHLARRKKWPVVIGGICGWSKKPRARRGLSPLLTAGRQCRTGAGPAPFTWAMTSATKSSCFFSMPAPTSKRSNATTRAAAPLSIFSTVTSGSFTKGWPARVISPSTLRSRPSTIFATISGGLPSPCAWLVRISRSFATTAAGTCSAERYRGLLAATCMARSWASLAVPPSSAVNAPIRVPCT